MKKTGDKKSRDTVPLSVADGGRCKWLLFSEGLALHGLSALV
jgi:hypothetical protein